MEEKKQQFDIELNREVAQGTYSNLSIISHSSSEFIVDFIRIMPGMPRFRWPAFSVRISPVEPYMKVAPKARESIRKFSQMFI